MQFLRSGPGSRKFFLKDFRNAEHYKPDIAPPRQKFQGYVNFIINRRLIAQMEDTSTFRTRISSLVRSATLPEINFVTEMKNSFNRKKIIQTGVEHSPVSVTVMDTVQNEWLTLFMKYYSFHYMNPRNKFEGGSRDTSFAGGDTMGGFQSSSFGSKGEGKPPKGYEWDSNDFGLNLGITKNFFERIDMILYHGNTGVQYSLFNPMMKGFSASEIDYSSSDVMDFKLDFEYENFTTVNVYNFELAEQDKARFERMEGANLPGMGAIRKPVAIETETPISILGGEEERKRTPQFKTGGAVGSDKYIVTEERETKYDTSDEKFNKLYTPSKLAEDAGETGFFGKINNFLENNPFGRIIDRGLSAKINGQDMGDVLKGALTDEINYAITNEPGDKDIFNLVTPGDESDKQNTSGNKNPRNQPTNNQTPTNYGPGNTS